MTPRARSHAQRAVDFAHELEAMIGLYLTGYFDDQWVNEYTHYHEVLAWRTNRVVYTADTRMLELFRDTEPSAPIVGAPLRHLPHGDVFIAFSEPMCIGGESLVRGAYITRTMDDSDPTGPTQFVYRNFDPDIDDPDDPNITIMVTLVYDVPEGWRETAPTAVRDASLMTSWRIGVETGTDGTVEERTTALMSAALEQYRRIHAVPGTEVIPPREEFLEALTFAVTLVTYITQQPEDQDLQDAGSKAPHPQTKTSGRPPRMKTFRLGYRVGKKIVAARHRAEQDAREHSTRTGRTVLPHYRRGFPRVQRYGPRNSLRKNIWIEPTWVGINDGKEQVHAL